jgi:4-amino-4-deoxy-L-arabinose transferase-like glycosyltransferase
LSKQLTAFRQHRAFLLVVAFAAALFLSDIWVYREFVRAESYFALGARLMIDEGSWLTPHAPDELPLNKPPLTYWLIGISYKLFGANYGSARLPSVLAALAVLAIVYAFGRRMSGVNAGLASAAMLGTSFLFVSFARMAMSDMLLTLGVTAAFACFITVLSKQTSRPKLLAGAGYFGLAIGFLSKGPVALLLVAFPIAVDLLWARRLQDLKRLHLIQGLLLFLLVAGPYFLLVYMRAGWEPLRFFFLAENLQRFTGQVYGESGRPWWFMVPTFFADFAPWSPLIFVAAGIHWRNRQSATGQVWRVLFFAVAFSIVLFSFSSFKLDYYLLPVMSAAALLVGSIFSPRSELSPVMRRLIAIFLITGSVLVVTVAGFGLKAAAIVNVSGLIRFLPILVAIVGMALEIIYLARRKDLAAALILAGTIAATMLSLELVMMPGFARFLPSTKLVRSVQDNRDWYTSWPTSEWANSIEFNLPPPHRVERLIGDRENQTLRQVLASNPRAVLVMQPNEYTELAQTDPALKILAEAETFGHAGPSLKMLRDPRTEKLLLVGH